MCFAKGMPWLISIASPSALSISASIIAISEKSPLCISANTEAEPTKPQPTITAFLKLIIKSPFYLKSVLIISLMPD